MNPIIKWKSFSSPGGIVRVLVIVNLGGTRFFHKKHNFGSLLRLT